MQAREGWSWGLGALMLTACQFQSNLSSGQPSVASSTGEGSSGAGTTAAPVTGETSVDPDTTSAPTSTDTSGGSASTDASSSDSTGSEATGDGASTSSSSSGEPLELQIAEELLVSLDATNGNASAAGWINDGTMADFEPIGSPSLGAFEGVSAVALSSGNGFRSAESPPATLVEPDSTRTVEVWVVNPEAIADESMVAWGRRNGPAGSLMVFNYGTHPDWGAANHWGEADMPWATVPQQNVWHHLVYTFDGTTTRVYVDGVLDNEAMLGAGVIDTHDQEPIVIGAQTRDDGSLTNWATVSVARIRIHAGALTDDQVAINYELERAELGL